MPPIPENLGDIADDDTMPISNDGPAQPDVEYSLAMTAGAISSLMICRDELKVSGLLRQDMERRMLLTVAGALHWVGEHSESYRFSRGVRLEPLATADGLGLYYDLYSVERAGVLSGMRVMSDFDWYREGTEMLLAAQAGDGRWPTLADQHEPRMVDACFAVLFLKRAAVPMHEETRQRVLTGLHRGDSSAEPPKDEQK